MRVNRQLNIQKTANGDCQAKMHTKLNYKRADYEKINHLFKDLHSDLKSPFLLPTLQQWDKLKQIIDTATTDHIPRVEGRRRGKTWMTRDMLRLMRKQKRIYLKSKKYPNL